MKKNPIKELYDNIRKIKVKPCPCCGSKEVLAGVMSCSTFGVKCYDCGLKVEREMDWRNTAAENLEMDAAQRASKVWNKRV